MSALYPRKRTFRIAMSDLPPEIGHLRCNQGCPLWAKSGHPKAPADTRSLGGTFWSSTGTMSHSKNCETHAIEFFGWFADVYRAFRQLFWLPMLTAKRLRKVLSYVPTTGIFRWKVNAGSRAPVGTIAGAKNGRGYHQIRIGGQPYSASRLAWLYMTGKWPNSEISYINGKPSDTRWANLRKATSSPNRNRPKRK
jgi:hypothetical protein